MAQKNGGRVYYIDECLDEVHRIALGRPCPDRDHVRLRLLDIMHEIMVPPVTGYHAGNNGSALESEPDD